VYNSKNICPNKSCARYRSDSSIGCGTNDDAIYRSVFIDLSKLLSCDISNFFCSVLWKLVFCETAFCVAISKLIFAWYRSDSSVGCGTDDDAIYRSVFYWPIEMILRYIEFLLYYTVEISLLRNSVLYGDIASNFARYRSDYSVGCGTDRVAIYRSVFIDISKWLSCDISNFFCSILWKLVFCETAFRMAISKVIFARYRSDSSVGCGIDRVAIHRNVFIDLSKWFLLRDIEDHL